MGGNVTAHCESEASPASCAPDSSYRLAILTLGESKLDTKLLTYKDQNMSIEKIKLILIKIMATSVLNSKFEH